MTSTHTSVKTESARACALMLQDAPAVLEVPTDRPRPAQLGRATEVVTVELDVESTADLIATATSAGADLYSVLVAGWLVVLRRTTDEPDLVLGCGGHPAVTRPDGLLVLRRRVELEQMFLAVVAGVNEALQDVGAEGDVTLPEVLSALSAEPGPGKHPVFQVGVAELAGADALPWTPGDGTVSPDVVLNWWRTDDGIGCRLDYSPELFDRRRMTRLAGHLTNVLRSAVRSPSDPVGALPLLAEDELHELRAWNATEHEHDASTNLAASFREQARSTPDAVAVEHLSETLTYQQLEQRADVLAAQLQQAGVGPDVTVVVCAERSFDMVVGVLGVLLAGGVYVPVDPAYPLARRTFMIEDSGAAVILTQRHLFPEVPSTLTDRVLFLDDVAPDGTPVTQVQSHSSGGDLGYVIYTSGSTGQPKGVALPQSALVNLLAWQSRRPQAVTPSRTLQFSSLSFDVSFQEVFSTWSTGGTLVLVPDETRRDPLSLLDFLIERRITRLFLPYVALRGLASAVARTGRTPDALREIYTAGEQLQADQSLRAMMRALPQCRLENQYGPSESHVVTAHSLAGDPDSWPALPPIGRAIDNSEVHVLDSWRQPRPVGVPGELYLGGACLARGYLGQPELTEERFVDQPLPTGRSTRLYRTGDVARWLPDGSLEFLGRTDHQVKFRGYRIEPGEIGTVLSGAPGVEQCVAVVRENDGAARLTAYLVPSGGAGVDLGAVHGFARDHLPGHMVPSHYLELAELPLTSSGKVDTTSLPDASFDRGILSSPYVEATTSDEVVLADIWQQLLGVPEIGIHDDFFELGGDSLAGVELVEQISQRLGVELPLGALAQGPTIAQLARVLRQAPGATWGALVPLKTEGDKRPLFIVHGGSGNVASFPRLARALPDDQPVYALQWDGLDGSPGRRTVEAMASHYLAQVRSVQPQGPYLLAGQCIGGLVAREMTRLVQREGEEVQLLVMYDSPHLGSPAYTAGHRSSRLQELKAPDGRRAKLEILIRQTLRVNIPVQYRPRHGQLAMLEAGWRHQPSDLPKPVLTYYIGSGESRGKALGLDGSWSDGAMGWAHLASDHFVLHRVAGGHNEILYSDEALELLDDALTRCHASPGRVG